MRLGVTVRNNSYDERSDPRATADATGEVAFDVQAKATKWAVRVDRTILNGG